MLLEIARAAALRRRGITGESPHSLRVGRHAVTRKEVICASIDVIFEVGEGVHWAPLIDLCILARRDSRSSAHLWDLS